MFLNKKLQIFASISLCLPTIVCPMESSPLLLSPASQTNSELLSSPTALHSPSSNSQSSCGTPVTVTIDRNSCREPLLSPQEHGTVPRAQKSLLTAYAMGAGAIVIFLTGFSVGKSSCNP